MLEYHLDYVYNTLIMSAIKLNYVILHVGTNDSPCKAGSDISNEILELRRFIKEKHPACKKITLSAPIICTDNYNANKENESFISSLNKSDVSYITLYNIIKKTFIYGWITFK